MSRLWSFLNRRTQDLCSLTYTKLFLGMLLGLHVPSPLTRQGLKGMSAEKKSAADLVQHTKVSPVSPHGYSQNPSSSLASSFVPTWKKMQRANPWLQPLENCRCPLFFLLPARYWQLVSL